MAKMLKNFPLFMADNTFSLLQPRKHFVANSIYFIIKFWRIVCYQKNYASGEDPIFWEGE